MACSIQFVRLDDFIADIDVLDLSTDGYSLAVDGYFPMAAPIGAKSVHEVITLKLQGTSKDDLAAMTQEIDEKIKQVQWWMEEPGVERYQVWIRVQLENETYPRQAQILNIQPPDKIRLFTPEERNDNYIGAYPIGIERTPFWEDPYPYPTTTTITGLSAAGGVAALSETINGDAPARAAQISIAPESSSILSEFWYGFKSNRFGNPANFVPVWSLYLSEYRKADTTIVADATTINGVSKVQCTFSPATLTTRTITIVDDVASANPGDQRGSYQVLLRAKMSDSSVARVRMAYSFAQGTLMFNPIYRSRQTVQGTAWKLYPLGIAVIPSLRIAPNIGIANSGIGIDTERISGSGNLDMDCFILIPVDDGAIYTNTSAGYNLATGQQIDILQAADDSLRAYPEQSSSVLFSANVYPTKWYGIVANSASPRIVFAAQKYIIGNTSEHDKSYTVSVSYTYIPRWRTLRGNST